MLLSMRNVNNVVITVELLYILFNGYFSAEILFKNKSERWVHVCNSLYFEI